MSSSGRCGLDAHTLSPEARHKPTLGNGQPRTVRPRALVQADRGRSCDIEALRATGHRDAHAVRRHGATSGGSPCASGPNSHAVGAGQIRVIELTSPSTVVARPAARPPAAPTATLTVGLFRPPAPRRCCPPRRAGTCRCTGRRCCPPERPRRHPSRPPPGSASRISRFGDLHRDRHQPGPGEHVVERGFRHRAHRDQSDRSHRSDNAFAARSVTNGPARRPAGAEPGRAASVANTSETSPRRNAASTRLGPSARKRAARRRPTWRCSLTAAATRAERSVSVRQPRPRQKARSRPRAAQPWRPPPAR